MKAEFVPTETPQRVPFLVADKIDISLGALTRSAERAKLIDYTVPLHTEVMAVLTTDKVAVDELEASSNDAKYTLANMRGNWTVDYLKQNCRMPRWSWSTISPTPSDWWHRVAPTRSSRTSTSSWRQTKNYPDVKWKVLPDPIDVGYCAIGVGRGNYPLRDVLNIVLYGLHSCNFVNETWEKWYGAPMLVKVVPSPYF